MHFDDGLAGPGAWVIELPEFDESLAGQIRSQHCFPSDGHDQSVQSLQPYSICEIPYIGT
ncbi:hypothetical protein GCM10027562_16000 [Arthrobacter pigmenti]